MGYVSNFLRMGMHGDTIIYSRHLRQVDTHREGSPREKDLARHRPG